MKAMWTALISTLLIGLLALAYLWHRQNEEITVAGQVFVVRNDRETIRLSGTVVRVVRGPAVSKVANLAASNEVIQAEANGALRKANERLDAATRAETEAVNAYEAKRKDVVRLERVIKESAELMRYMPADRRAQAAKTNRARAERLEEATKEQNRLFGQHQSAKEDLARVETEGEAALARSKDLRSRARTLIDNPEFYRSTHQVITDADGRFSITVPKREPTTLVVRSERTLFGGKEHYLWAEPVQGTNMLLSNVNIAISVTDKNEERSAH